MTQTQKCSASIFASKNSPGKQCPETAAVVSSYNDPTELPPAWAHGEINTSLCVDHKWLEQEDEGLLVPDQFYLLGSCRAFTGWGYIVRWIFPVGSQQAGMSRLRDIARQSRNYAVLVDDTGRIIASTATCGSNSCYCQVRTADADAPNIFYQRAIRQLMAQESEVVQ